jgi:hypothetical protein
MAFNFKRPGTSFVGHISGCSAEAVALWNAGNADLSTKAGHGWTISYADLFFPDIF